MSTPTARDSLGDLAATGPEVRSVLLRHQLDFCCGGGRSLEAACEKAGLAVDEVLTEIATALAHQPDATRWEEQSDAALIDHILARYHAPLPGQLDGVIAAAEKVERVHAAKPSCPRGLAAHLHRFRDALTAHMQKEERVLFPALAAGHRGPALGTPVSVMTREHDEHGHALRELRRLAHDLVPPPEACRTWRALYEELQTIEADLMAHVHLENHVLFPRAVADWP